jgi:hypothetical protein
MILVNCNSSEYLDEVGYIFPTDIFDMIPLLYTTEFIKCSDTNVNYLHTVVRTKIEEKSQWDLTWGRPLSWSGPYDKLKNLNKVIVFYMESDDLTKNEMKDIVFCVVCSEQYTKEQLLTIMKRYSKLKVFL